MAWLTGWSYRKPITISNAATDYQTKITVYYGSGTDGDNYVYCNSRCKTDFGDIRFTKSDGTTLLDIWRESKTDSGNAVFWVENDGTPQTSGYIYYGNSGATYPYLSSELAHGQATFLFFDDFDDNDISDWTQVQGTFTAANGFISNDSSVLSRIKKAFNDSGGLAYEIKIRGTESGQYAWAGIQIRSPTTDYFGGQGYDQGYLCLIYTPTGNAVRVYKATAGTVSLLVSTSYTFSLNTWYKFKVTYLSGTIKTYINDALVNSVTDTTYTTGEVIRIWNTDMSLNHDFDNIFVHKYASTEPTFTFGTEQTTYQRTVGFIIG